ncbi:MAG TPA: S-layer homology domain-containing protein, partial [Thermoanaerobaculia bacterium]
LAPAVGLLLSSPAVGLGTSAVPNPTVVFSTPGTKQVTLQVCNDAGCSTVTRNVVVMDPMPHITGVAGLPSSVDQWQSVPLSAQTTGRPPLTVRWLLIKNGSQQVIPGNPAMWDTGKTGSGDFQVQVEVLNSDGSVLSTPVPVTVRPLNFSDIGTSYWARSFIDILYARGITSGCAGNPPRFCPTDYVTRDQMAVFLVRAKRGASFVPAAAVGFFADVNASYWAAPQIEQLYHDGITTGCAGSPPRYCPDSLVSRAEMAVFLLRAKYGASYAPPAPAGTLFSDVPASYWAAAWIEQLAADGITTGCGAGRFCPEDKIRRDEMAAFLVRTFGLTLP